jgi:hypothetical protein
MSNRTVTIALAVIVLVVFSSCAHDTTSPPQGGTNGKDSTAGKDEHHITLPENMNENELNSFLEQKANRAVLTLLNRGHGHRLEVEAAEATLVRIGERCLPKILTAINVEFSAGAPENYKWLSSPGELLMHVLMQMNEIESAPADVRISYYSYMLAQPDANDLLYGYLYGKEGRPGRLALRKLVSHAFDKAGGMGKEPDRCLSQGELLARNRAMVILAYYYRDEWIWNYAADILRHSTDASARFAALETLYEFTGPDYIVLLCSVYAETQDEEWEKELRGAVLSGRNVKMRNDQRPAFFEGGASHDERMQAALRWVRENYPYLYLSQNPKDCDYYLPGSRPNLLLIDEYARREGVPHDVWIRIPEDDRSIWETLSSEQQNKLIKEAHALLQEDQQEYARALNAAVSVELWKALPPDKREKWDTLSEEEQAQLVADVERKLSEKAAQQSFDEKPSQSEPRPPAEEAPKPSAPAGNN